MINIDWKLILAGLVVAVCIATGAYVSHLRSANTTLTQQIARTEADFVAVKKSLELMSDYYEIDKEVKRELFTQISAIDSKRRPAVGELFLQ